MRWTSRILLSTVAATVLLPAPASADCNNPFADPTKVLDFHIRMSSADWKAILDEDATKANPDGDLFNPAACFYKYKQYRAEFRCGDSGPWIKVSVRKKRGQERGNEAPQKPPLKIDFNQDFDGAVPEARGQSWPSTFGQLGYRKLTLANGQGNKPPGKPENLMLPILMTEHTTLRLLKQEIPAAPSTAYAKVIVHLDGDAKGQYRGVYAVVEDIDKGAIKRYFGSNDGRLVKSTKDNCNNELEYDDGPPNESVTAYESFIVKKPEDFPAPGAWLAEAEKGLDLDTLLRQEAIREILVNGDDTILTAANRQNDGLNYFTFDPRKGKRQYIPWDVDLTFGQQNGNCAPPAADAPSTASPNSMRLMCAPDEPLFRWCPDSLSQLGLKTVCVKAAEPQEIKKRYLEIMCQLTRGTLSADNVLKVWDQVYATLSPLVPMEKDLVWQGMDPSNATIPKSFGAEYKRLRDWIPARIRSVQEQVTRLGVACAPGCQDGAKEACSYLGCAGERRCTGGKWVGCAPMGTCANPQPKVLLPPATGDEGGCRFVPGAPAAGALAAPLSLVVAALALGLRRRRRR